MFEKKEATLMAEGKKDSITITGKELRKAIAEHFS